MAGDSVSVIDFVVELFDVFEEGQPQISLDVEFVMAVGLDE